ncbi:DUF4197 domain-containing protein [Catenovulum sp. 2E275]|uniref:DUF4197 domain-containing protein n=1 Tax=Catenovulum sp. 2E275 TaxID=2980497 RepID=UPI0021D16F94|nr:DUF4197 domain-containing protein [Catenovulum sp. 2E275]MCU4676687.1 DUF4197 domain-containing protein [Catenovulum sp. 2E275]
MPGKIKVLPICIALSFAISPLVSAESWWEKATNVVKENIPSDSDNASEATKSNLGAQEITEAFKQALKIGSEKVIAQLGETDGFYADPKIHIPLPTELEKAKMILSKVGMANLADDLELKLNRAAEAATPQAKALFVAAIQDMSFSDVRAIYEGEKDSATQYFKQKMSDKLSVQMKPIVDQSIAEVGAIQALDKLLGEYKDIPFVSKVKTDISSHVIDKGIEGIFYYIAQEEAAIRENPSEQTTALLKKVFGL